MAKAHRARLLARRARLLCEQLEERQLLSADLDLAGVEWRTIDGTNNNLTPGLEQQGAAETRQIRFGYGVEFTDADAEDVGNVLVGPDTTPGRPNARTISNAIHAQAGSVTSGRHLTDWAFQWGQWITHDMDLTRTGPEFDVLLDEVTLAPTGEFGDYSIPIEDPNDPLGPNPIPFNRSEFDPSSVNDVDENGLPDPSAPRRHQINSITSYIDASMVYGSDQARADNLRTFVGGKLKTSANGLLLPLNTVGEENADALGLGEELFLAGDVRANEQLNLTVVHTLFVREHNRLAGRIAQLYPDLTDDEIYEVARRIVGAEMQIITYEEYLPAIFGYDLAPDPHAASYDPAVDASVTNSFAHAAFRFGHSQVNETTLLVNNLNQTVGSLSVRDAFFNPDFLKDAPGNVGRMLKGLASQRGQEVDLLLVDGIRNNLFGPPGAGGLDLAALDIQRGRDHGLPDFNTLRRLYGVGPALTSFDQISSDPAVRAKLLELYGNVDNIDPFVGMLAEDHLPGTSVGPTLFAIVGNQFERLRDGDRFFYTNDAFLQSEGVRQIIDLDDVTLANVIRWNTGVFNIQDNVFFERSVLIFEAPEAGSNVSLVAALGAVSLIDNHSGQVLAVRALANVEQVILVGSNTGADVFNLFIAAAAGGIEDGVIAYGGSSAGDRLNVYGLPLIHDTFTVADSSFSTGTVDVNGDDAVRTVGGRTVDVNGNKVFSSGFETTRLVTLGGDDTIIDPLGLASVVTLWNPLDDD